MSPTLFGSLPGGNYAVAFWGAVASARLYGGVLFDPNGHQEAARDLDWKDRLGQHTETIHFQA